MPGPQNEKKPVFTGFFLLLWVRFSADPYIYKKDAPMKVLTILLGLMLSSSLHAQCAGQQSFTLNPPPTNNTYPPGTVVTVCYTMNGWNGTGFGSNWLEGFDLNVGPGWTTIIPSNPPINCSNAGQWIWVANTVTSSSTGIIVGPGWFYEGPAGPQDGNPGNDWGDYGINCSWSFCFQLVASQQCTPQSLLIQITAGADGTWGSWGINGCPSIAFNIFNGTINGSTVVTSPISHN